MFANVLSLSLFMCVRLCLLICFDRLRAFDIYSACTHTHTSLGLTAILSNLFIKFKYDYEYVCALNQHKVNNNINEKRLTDKRMLMERKFKVKRINISCCKTVNWRHLASTRSLHCVYAMGFQ